ncbi:MAG: glycosyltransferase [Lachnospiraceae bacterium]|nr:glycosyltransferase [Lachnospiraceae bacterium]
MSVDVIILTYKPDRKFLKTMDALKNQSVKAGKVIIINTEKKYFEELIAEAEFRNKYDTSVIYHIDEQDFDHGKTRNFAVSHVNAEYFVMMTQDAVPADNHLIESLLVGINNTDNIAVTYARQLPNAESNELERFIRTFNYGSAPINKSRNDLKKLGIKTYFCSNVCAVYNHAIFKKLGGFTNKTIFNEDMIYAANAIASAYKIRYEPKAMVYHDHHYTYRKQFKRNFDLGVSHAEYPEVFGGLTAESEGIRMIKSAALHLIKKRKPSLIFVLFGQSLAKYRGFRLGKSFKKLSPQKIAKYTNSPFYW